MKKQIRHEKIAIYHAAALFNGRELLFNSVLTEGLEKRGYKVNLPQRDGFEFGMLNKYLSKKLPKNEMDSALSTIIYLLDVGHFIPKSDVVLANLDEPLDEGVVVEISYARILSKFVIGMRTDVRSPFGNLSDPLKGMHFFPAYQCNKFISHDLPCRTPDELEAQINSLINKIDNTIKIANIFPQAPLSNLVLSNPKVSIVLNNAKLLFSGISDRHSDKGLEEIAARYVKYKDKFKPIVPIII